jgi:hypothetical protein
MWEMRSPLHVKVRDRTGRGLAGSRPFCATGRYGATHRQSRGSTSSTARIFRVVRTLVHHSSGIHSWLAMMVASA